jgi:hypothetical protein
MLLTSREKRTRVPVGSTVKVAEPPAWVLTAGTTSLPVSSAVYVVPSPEAGVDVVDEPSEVVEVVVASDRVELAPLVGVLVDGVVEVLTVPSLSQPAKMSTAIRRGMSR